MLQAPLEGLAALPLPSPLPEVKGLVPTEVWQVLEMRETCQV